MSIRPRRSVLYMPGSNARALDKARELSADGLILDLEDAVAPDAKGQARALVTEAVSAGGYGKRELVVRVNGLGTPWGYDDVAAVARLPVDGVLFPKVESAGQIEEAIESLDKAGAREDLPLWIMAETPRGVLEIDAIAGASPRLACIVVGTSDLAKELRVQHTRSRIGFLGPLSLCLLAARAHGVDILDGVHLDLGDEAGFRNACEQGRDMGFDGKTLIHPKQIATANEIFAPSEDAIETARAVIAAWDRGKAEGKGVVVVNGRLVERLHADEARRTLALAEAIDAISGD